MENNDLEMYEARLKESTSTGDLQELYGFHFQGEYKDIHTRTFRFMATANSLDEVTTWFNLDEVEYVKCLGEYKLNLMEEQEFLTPEEVAKLQSQDIAEHSTNVINGVEHEYFGDSDAPVFFSIEEEGKSTICVRGWTTYDLVSFGNYLLNKYDIQQSIEGDTFIDRQVTDADLANWRFLYAKNELPISSTNSTDDEVYGRGFVYTNIDGQDV